MSNKYKGIPGLEGLGRRTLNVGHGNFVMAEEIVAILEAGPLPIRRLREQAGKKDLLVDATAGRKTRSLIVTRSNHVVLSAVSPHALHDRFQDARPLNPARLEVEQGEFVS